MSKGLRAASKRKVRLLGYVSASILASMIPAAAQAATVTNPNTGTGCSSNMALFNPGSGKDINVPAGFKVSIFKAGLNMPTGIAFRKAGAGFEVYVLESGHGLPSACNDESTMPGGTFNPNNPFTPDILVFDQDGNFKRKLGKPTAPGVGFQTSGPAIDIAFENGLQGGRLFATDSNQATHAHNAQNNSSRIVTVDPMTGTVTPFITGLPTGDHPAEQLAFKDNWIYWSQGSTTNSGVVGLDNGNGQNQQDIPCQDITLSRNVFDSGVAKTSGYSPFGVQRPGVTIKAFDSALHKGVCDGAILRARLNSGNPAATIEPFSWGYRNGYAIRFAPNNHALAGGLLVGEDGADERGARPSNNAPDVLSLAKQNKDGSPDYHGWPDRYGFLATNQAVFNPVGGPADDVPISPADVPIRDVLAFPPQPITSPLALEAADSSFTGIDFVPNSFAVGPVQRGAALYSLEGDFGFSAPNSASDEIGHEIKLINFSKVNEPLTLQITRFAKNNTGDQAFITGADGFNRPLNVRFGPDGCAWIPDYGAVRDLGSDTHFQGPPANGPLLQIPGTGVIFRICPTGRAKGDDD